MSPKKGVHKENFKREIAPLSLRIKAWLLDFFVGYVITGVFLLIIVSVLIEKSVPIIELLSSFLIVVTMFVYWILTPYLSNGQTLGKYVFHLKIIDISGKRLSIRQLIKRTFGSIFPMITYLRKMKFDFNDDIPLEHDRLASTRVVILPKK